MASPHDGQRLGLGLPGLPHVLEAVAPFLFEVLRVLGLPVRVVLRAVLRVLRVLLQAVRWEHLLPVAVAVAAWQV